jgi:hypothetical protein
MSRESRKKIRDRELVVQELWLVVMILVGLAAGWTLRGRFDERKKKEQADV